MPNDVMYKNDWLKSVVLSCNLLEGAKEEVFNEYFHSLLNQDDIIVKAIDVYGVVSSLNENNRALLTVDNVKKLFAVNADEIIKENNLVKYIEPLPFILGIVDTLQRFDPPFKMDQALFDKLLDMNAVKLRKIDHALNVLYQSKQFKGGEEFKPVIDELITNDELLGKLSGNINPEKFAKYIIANIQAKAMWDALNTEIQVTLLNIPSIGQGRYLEGMFNFFLSKQQERQPDGNDPANN